MAPKSSFSRQGGLTLIEMIVAMVIAGILVAIVAAIMKGPIDGYVDVRRRAELTDAGDTALRRIGREVRTALPNSLRTCDPTKDTCNDASESDKCFEILPVVGGGRYRTTDNASGKNDAGDQTCEPDHKDDPGCNELDFSTADSSFDVLSGDNLPPTPSFATATYHVVIYNLGIPGADAYAASAKNASNDDNNNRAIIKNTSSSGKIELSAKNQFPLEPSYRRFFVIPDQSVVYSCSGGNLLRTTQAISATKMAACPSAGSILVSNVTDCHFDFTPAVTARSGLLTMRLQLSRDGETVTLYEEVHVDNVP